MSELAVQRENDNAGLIPFPGARVAISIRPAVMSDLAFIDALQKKHSKMVGWFPTKQIETNIEQGHVLIAETAEEGVNGCRGDGVKDAPSSPADQITPSPSHRVTPPSPLGYCIARDKYMKREDCGIVYQLNVAPGSHRKLVGASLIQATFERAAYGCRLFSCWCAQDLEANHFWESIGFVPLAFRTGSRGRGKKAGGAGPRIHIFWQKRIREGDCETPYWFPSETSGGAVRENRLILPIPPGTHWSDAKPAVLPGMEKVGQPLLEAPGEGERRKRSRCKKTPAAPAAARGGLWFGAKPEEKAKDEKPKRAKRKPQKNDPKLVAAARELCARYLEEVQTGRMLPGGEGKYDVARQLEEAPTVMQERDAVMIDERPRLLDAA